MVNKDMQELDEMGVFLDTTGWQKSFVTVCFLFDILNKEFEPLTG